MKRLLFIFYIFVSLTTSCSSKNKGSISGGLLGSPPEPLLVGSGGALTQEQIGIATKAQKRASLNPVDREVLEQRAPSTLKKLDNRQQLDLQDIKNMSKNSLSGKTIIQQLEDTRSTFSLTCEEISDLRDYGVPEEVIDLIVKSSK